MISDFSINSQIWHRHYVLSHYHVNIRPLYYGSSLLRYIRCSVNNLFISDIIKKAADQKVNLDFEVSLFSFLYYTGRIAAILRLHIKVKE